MNTLLQQPVSGKDFFDREELLQELISGKHHIALIGPRKAGKTSLFQQYLQTNNTCITAYYYIPFEITLDYFCYEYFNAIATAYLKDIHEYRPTQTATPHSEFTELLRDLIRIRPDIAGYLSDLQNIDMKTRNTGELRGILKGFLDLPYRLRRDSEGEKDIVIILDEFQNVSVLRDLVPDVLREKIIQKKGVFYYLAGSEIGIMNDMLNQYNTPLFGHLSQYRVDCFPVEDARQFVLYLLRQKGVLMNEHVLNYLVSLTGGFPYYLRVLAAELIKIARERGNEFIAKEDIVHALTHTLFRKTGALSIYFTETLEMNLRRKRSGRYYQLLQTLSQKPYTLSALATETGMAVTSIPTYLQDLEHMELIDQHEGAYVLKDELMRFWLQAVYPHSEDIQTSMEEKRDAFMQEASKLLNAYKAELGVAREAQIRELFVLRGIYSHVRGGYLEGQEFDIIAQGEKGFVIGEIKTRNVVMADVEKFQKKMDTLRSITINERILVGLMGIEQAARDLADNSGIQIWDLEQVNTEREKYGLALIRI